MKEDKKKRKRENIFTNVGFVSLLIVFFLLIGALGYYLLDSGDWVEAFYTSASIMTSVGALDAPQSNSGKIFSIFFTLVTNLLFLFIVSYIVQFYASQGDF